MAGPTWPSRWCGAEGADVMRWVLPCPHADGSGPVGVGAPACRRSGQRHLDPTHLTAVDREAPPGGPLLLRGSAPHPEHVAHVRPARRQHEPAAGLPRHRRQTREPVGEPRRGPGRDDRGRGAQQTGERPGPGLEPLLQREQPGRRRRGPRRRRGAGRRKLRSGVDARGAGGPGRDPGGPRAGERGGGRGVRVRRGASRAVTRSPTARACCPMARSVPVRPLPPGPPRRPAARSRVEDPRLPLPGQAEGEAVPSRWRQEVDRQPPRQR